MEQLEEIEISADINKSDRNQECDKNSVFSNGVIQMDGKLSLLMSENLVDSGIAISSSFISESINLQNSNGKEKNNSKANTPVSDSPDLSELPNDIFFKENGNEDNSAVTSENCSIDHITSISDSLFENDEDNNDIEELIDDIYINSEDISIETEINDIDGNNEHILVAIRNNPLDIGEHVSGQNTTNKHISLTPDQDPTEVLPFSNGACDSHFPTDIEECKQRSKRECDLNQLMDHCGQINKCDDNIRNINIPLHKNVETDDKTVIDEKHTLKNISENSMSANTDTTQRPVHEPLKTKTKEIDVRNKEYNNTSCTSSAATLVSKPPSGQTGSPPSSIPPSSADSQNPSVAEGNNKASAMAFTVDFGDSGTSDSSGSAGMNKRLEISGPLSQFAPKHKRNISLVKTEENKKVAERKIEKPPVGRPRSNTTGAIGTRRGGYHSEGYFSSDQEDDATKKAESKSPRSPKSTGAPSSRSTEETQKAKILRVRPDSPSNSYTVPLTESANFLIEKMLTATPELKRKNYGKAEGRTCCKDRKPSVPELGSRLNRSPEKINSQKSDTESSRRNSKSSPTFSDPSKEDDKDDDASDAGTYTIDKDSPEVEAARNDIGRAFGVIPESDAELTSSTAVPLSTNDAILDEESWLSSSEIHKPKITPVISRNTPNWIQEWAQSVAEQTKPAVKCMPTVSPIISPRNQKCNVTPQSSLQDNLDVRPRRKLPTPPQYPSPRSYSKDHSYEQQSIPKTKSQPSKTFRNHFESQESGCDSDLDFRSYSYTDDERLTASLRDKLRLTGLNASSPKNLPSPRASPRRFIPLKEPTENNTIEDVFCEKLSEQSDDSSSETSGPYKEPIRIADNNPPLKFNRAFSLRRARLACEDPSPKQVIEKKKTIRPSSAGNLRKVQSTGNRNYQSVDSSSVSSCRSFGYGPVNNVKTARPFNDANPSDCMIRNDGGRFSLRLSRSASSSVVKSPSKAAVAKRESTPKKGLRSNSMLSSKEVEFQNWKRRKNYDPMKAAAEGRKKQLTKRIVNPEQNGLTSDSSGQHNSLLRSASFHGTNGTEGMRWQNKLGNHVQYTSEEDGPYSLEEEVPHRVTSPLRRSPTSPNQMYSPVLRHYSQSGRHRGFRNSIDNAESNATPHFQVSPRKVSLDESGSEGKMSPLNSQGSARGNRPKTKMEALDNLVISTIHSLSVKVRTTAESLLLKLKSQYDEEGERAALLQEVLAHLSESDQSPSSQNRSTSRELAGILRNLKKVEHALQVVDRVMITGEFIDEEDQEDIPNDWGESDY